MIYSGSVKKFKLPEYLYKADDALDELEILTSLFQLLTFNLPASRRQGIKAEFTADLKKRKGKIVSIIGQLVTRKVTSTRKDKP